MIHAHCLAIFDPPCAGCRTAVFQQFDQSVVVSLGSLPKPPDSALRRRPLPFAPASPTRHPMRQKYFTRRAPSSAYIFSITPDCRLSSIASPTSRNVSGFNRGLPLEEPLRLTISDTPYDRPRAGGALPTSWPSQALANPSLRTLSCGTVRNPDSTAITIRRAGRAVELDA